MGEALTVALLQQIFAVDPLACPTCRGPPRPRGDLRRTRPAHGRVTVDAAGPWPPPPTAARTAPTAPG
jgi:hypothetical protein